MKNILKGVVIVCGIIIIQGALGASDNFSISFAECLIRCAIGMVMIAGAIWIPKIKNLHKAQTKEAERTDKNAA